MECFGDDVIGEGRAPGAERHVRGSQGGDSLIECGDEVELLVGGIGVSPVDRSTLF